MKGSDTMSLSQSLFTKRVKLIAKLQDTAYQTEDMQNLRKRLIETCHQQVCELNPEQAITRMYREQVERFKDIQAFDTLDAEKINELVKDIATIIYEDDTDEYAKRYDNTIYAMMLDTLEGSKSLQTTSRKLTRISSLLMTKNMIGAVAKEMSLIKATAEPTYWTFGGILDHERARDKLRSLIKFLSDTRGTGLVFARLDDHEEERLAGNVLPYDQEFEDYQAKVNRYVNEHGNMIAIHKLTHNIPLTENEYGQLEHILTSELGTKDDYQKAFQDTPFGILVRKIAGMDHEAVMNAFSDFIETEHLNQPQIAFVNKVISYVEKNGYIREASDLLKPPFDKPTNFFVLFDEAKQYGLINRINALRDNAERGMA